MAEHIKPYLVRHISDHERLSQTYADTAADQSLPKTARQYWQQQSNDHIIRAGTYRELLHALEWDIIDTDERS